MKKRRLLFLNIFKFLFALGIALSIFTSCSNLSGADEQKNNLENFPQLQRGEGEGILNGSIFSESDCMRTAMPGTHTVSFYEVTATNGTKIVTVPNSEIAPDGKFAISLPFGTWRVTANAMDSSGKTIFTQTQIVTLSESTPAVNLDFNLSYSQDVSLGPGKIDLTVKFPKPSISSFKIKTIDYSLYRGSSKIVAGISENEINNGEFKILHTVTVLGAYTLVINFYDVDGALLYRIDQIVNTYANLTTDKFEGNAKYISDGKINLTDVMIKAFKFSTFYVGGTGIGGKAADDNNSGSQFAPVKTLACAVALVNASPLTTPADGFNIIVQGNSSVGGDITLNKTLSIKSATAGTKYTITGAQNTFSANANLTTTDLTFNKTRFVVGSDNLAMTNCAVTGNTITGDGGAINISNGTATLKNCTFSGNTTTGKGNAIYNDGTLKLEGTQTFATNQDIYLAQDGSNVKPITIANTIILGTGTTAIKITPQNYANDIPVLIDDTSGTLVTNNYAKFAVTDQASGSNTIKWGVNAAGKLVPSLEVIYWNYLNIGGDSNSGATPSEAVETFSKVYELISDVTEKIVVVGGSVIKSAEITANSDLLNFSGRAEPIIIQRYNNSATPNPLIEIEGSLTVNNVIFDGNKTDVPSAGESSLIKIKNSATVTLENTIVKNNSANSSKGTINVDTGKLIIKSGCEIKDNVADEGGAVYVNDGAELEIKGGAISKNTATKGGGIYNGNGNLTLESGTISGNTASSQGGGIYNKNGDLTLESGTISGNKANVGGGIYNYSGKVTMSGGTISGNTATNGGGGIYIYSGTVTMSGGTIKDNTATGNGGGISNGTTSTFTMSGGTISGNSATGSSNNGDGIYNAGTLEFSGAATVNSNNDVYLPADKFITITDSLTATGAVANITLNNTTTPSQYEVGTQVLKGEGVTITDALCKKFKLLNPDGTQNTEFAIKPDGTGAKGVLSLPTTGGNITPPTTPDNVTFALSDSNGSGGIITISASSSGTPITGDITDWNIEVEYGARPTGISSTTNTVEILSTYPDGIYVIKVKGKYNDLEYNDVLKYTKN